MNYVKLSDKYLRFEQFYNPVPNPNAPSAPILLYLKNEISYLFIKILFVKLHKMKKIDAFH